MRMYASMDLKTCCLNVCLGVEVSLDWNYVPSLDREAFEVVLRYCIHYTVYQLLIKSVPRFRFQSSPLGAWRIIVSESVSKSSAIKANRES